MITTGRGYQSSCSNRWLCLPELSSNGLKTTDVIISMARWNVSDELAFATGTKTIAFERKKKHIGIIQPNVLVKSDATWTKTWIDIDVPKQYLIIQLADTRVVELTKDITFGVTKGDVRLIHCRGDFIHHNIIWVYFGGPIPNSCFWLFIKLSPWQTWWR